MTQALIERLSFDSFRSHLAPLSQMDILQDAEWGEHYDAHFGVEIVRRYILSFVVLRPMFQQVGEGEDKYFAVIGVGVDGEYFELSSEYAAFQGITTMPYQTMGGMFRKVPDGTNCGTWRAERPSTWRPEASLE